MARLKKQLHVSPKIAPEAKERVAAFYDKITRMEPKGGGYSEYGSRVTPVLDMYSKLQSYEERMAFYHALEKMLRARDAKTRSFAIAVCLGFHVFGDVFGDSKGK